MEAVQIAHNHLTDQELTREYKRRKQWAHHNPVGHVSSSEFTENTCFWLLILLLFLFFGVIFITYWTVPRTVQVLSPPEFRSNKRLLAASFKKRTACMTGEVFDTETQMCGPVFLSPLAFDGSIMDTAAVACDSFFQSMCGKWISEHTNENRAFTFGYQKNQARIKSLITSTSENALPGIREFYSSCMGVGSAAGKKESSIELRHVMERVVGDMRTHADLPTVFGRLARIGYTTPFVFSFEHHPLEPRVVPFIGFGSFPSSLDESRIYQILSHYRDVTNYNILEMQQRITSILKILRAIQEHKDASPDDITDYIGYINNRFPRDLVRFETLPSGWNLRGTTPMMSAWNNFFQALDGQSLRLHHDQEVWVIGRPYIQWLLTEGIAQFELADWRAYIDFSIIYNGVQFEPDLPQDVYFKQHEERGPLGRDGRFYQRIPRGNTTAEQTVESKCRRVTQHMLPGLVAKSFLNAYFPDKEAARQDVSKLVDRMRQSLLDAVGRTPWLSETDKDTLSDKLRATLVRVIEPDEWEVEPFADRLNPDRYDHNMNLIRQYRVQRNLALWHKDAPDTYNRSAIAYFLMPLTETNAYESPQTNTITILAGILQAPFYSLFYGEVTKHAILGSIIGHEMSHMLDHHGLYWDKNGSLRLKGILSESGMRAFYNQSDCVIIEYGPAPNGCEDANVAYGNSTVGEDLADLTGIQLAYDAYFKYTDAGRAAPLGDKQLFFMVLSQAFCETMDQAHLCEAVKEDVHAIAEFRINRTFRNLWAFQEAFGCHVGHGMYREKTRMCRVYG
jgi:predicted metalloendopeptidase